MPITTTQVPVMEQVRLLLDDAHLAVASLATLLDEQHEVDLENLSLEVKRVEAELCILESQLRHTFTRLEAKTR
jgi:hypothetical protein